MENDFILLVTKEEMWAKMLMEVLKDSDVVCAALPTRGAGLTAKNGTCEWLKIYVHQNQLERAKELYYELFPSERV